MRKPFHRLFDFITHLWDTRWRWVLIVIGFVFFIVLWTVPLVFLPDEYSVLGEYWVFGYILGPFYALSIWQVVSEDEREILLRYKIRQAFLSGFNKLLFALIVFILYILFLGNINGEF